MFQRKHRLCFKIMANMLAGRVSGHQGKVLNAADSKQQYSSSASTVVDLRSDTITHPTLEMRKAMLNAEVGDDVFGEDPTVKKLQDKVAALFGKEASLFVPTCTMANTIAILTHCDGRFNEIILGNKSHMFMYELGVASAIAGVTMNGIKNEADGTMKVEDIEAAIRPLNDVHQPWTRVICLENTQNKCGGKVLQLDYMESVKKVADKHNLKMHLDGARVFNAATALGVPVSQITQYFDTVSTAFTKGLCAPVGSVIAGSREFIQRATRARKALGGGMRQVGVIAAPVLETLDRQAARLSEDHARAKRIAQAIDSMKGNPVCAMDLEGVHSNIVMIDMIGSVPPPAFAKRMGEVPSDEVKHLGESISVLMLPFSETTVRYVLHNNISDEDVEKAIKKIKYVIEYFSQ